MSAIPTRYWQNGTSLWAGGRGIDEGSSYGCFPPHPLLEDQGAMWNAEWFLWWIPSHLWTSLLLNSIVACGTLMQVAWTKHCWFLSPLWFARVWCGVPRLAGDLILLVEVQIFLSGWSKQSFVSNSSSMCHIGQFPHVSWLSQAKDSQQKNNSHIHVYMHTHMQNQPFALNARKINMIFTASPTHAPSVIVTTLTSLMGLLPEPVWQQCATYTMGVLFFSNSVFMRFLWQLQKAVILTH